MKKLYLLLLVFLLLFIPATNAVTPYQLDHPIRELNGYTLREVFEEGNLFQYSTISSPDSSRITLSIIDNKNISYTVTDLSFNFIRFRNGVSLTSGNNYYNNVIVNFYTGNISIFTTPILINRLGVYSQKSITQSGTNLLVLTHSDINESISFQLNALIDMNSFGISLLTVEQMDVYYDYYLEAVQFEIDYYEAGLDPGEYQHIFKSILNGVKNLISEMGYVWQWLNAPIITTDMQDYSFNIDWSWDLIGVIRQIMNSAGILTLQIAFWVPSLAFAFMGIPVQISVLSLLFSNLIFLLLGWILVKSLLI